jgi:hypothetical protein
MNKIVIEHYPVSRLPEDIRAAVGGTGAVRVTVEQEGLKPQTAAEVVAQLRREKADPGFQGTTMAEAVARIRALRDEWED